MLAKPTLQGLTMSEKRRTRVVVFASGEVGHSAVLHLMECWSANLVGAVSAGTDPILTKLAEGHATPLVVWEPSLAGDCRDFIAALKPDVIILAWWPHILKKADLHIGQAYTLNMHPSYLPHCRGKDPNFWAIIEQRPFGVTIHHVDEGVDTGDIAFQQVIPIAWEDTGATLHCKAKATMMQLFIDVCPRIVALDIPRAPQSHEDGSFHLRRELDKASEINLDRLYTGREILDLLRARTFLPHAGAHFSESGKTYDVRVSIQKRSDTLEPG